MPGRLPQRIACLTDETTETLYRLGAQDRIVAISGFTVRPPEARREKPRVSGFTRVKLEKLLALEPDLVLTFSDLQADIAAALIRAGVSVVAFNQRTVQGILDMIATLGALVGRPERAAALIAELERGIAEVRGQAARLARRPRVYFEEWDDPMISGIGWVSELVEAAGGEDCFRELAARPNARERIIADPTEVVRRAPDIIVGSWCGKKFSAEKLAARSGWEAIPAVRAGALFEVKSSLILQPGPAALGDGLRALSAIVRRWSDSDCGAAGRRERV